MRVEFITEAESRNLTNVAVAVGGSNGSPEEVDRILSGMPAGAGAATWVRRQREFGRNVCDRMFASVDGNIHRTKELLAALDSEEDVRLCSKGEFVALKNADDSSPDTMLCDYFTNPGTIRPWRFRISCLLSRNRERQKPTIHDGSLRVAHVRYGPYAETNVVSGSSVGIFESKGTTHFQKFLRQCDVHPDAIGVPFDGEDPYRLLRREIRYGLETMLRFLPDALPK